VDAFLPLKLAHGPLATLAGAHVHGWTGAAAVVGAAGATVFALVDGPTELGLGEDRFLLRASCFAVAPGPVAVRGGRGLAIVVPGYVGLRQLGGPLEAVGRLRYIDGCSDTLLVSPPRRGEPCLNHLHLPAGTRQRAHTHPSVRIGLIARGRGVCVTADGAHPLAAGLGWVIPAGVRHAFHTDGEPLDVLAWHPDSDVGPTDEDHPMVNRTILG
jgi:quercetin dioxygenase-like cupin family protein